MTFTPPLDKTLADRDADQVRRSHAQGIRELQGLPIAAANLLPGVSLPNAVGRQIPHGLGRKPSMIWISPPRGAATGGVIQDYAGATPSGVANDQTKTLSLRAIDFGADIVVDIVVF